jgi:hypothetical protein
MAMKRKLVQVIFFSFGLTLVLSACNGYMSGRLKGTTTPLIKLKQARAAWEGQNIDAYYLYLTHKMGSEVYGTMAEIAGNKASCLAGGVEPVPITPAPSFPFPPLAETVRDLYDALERIWHKNDDIYVSFSFQNHNPFYIHITNDNSGVMIDGGSTTRIAVIFLIPLLFI